MAHEIQSRDSQIGLTMGWHGLTKVVEVIDEKNAFNWDIKRKPTYFHDGKTFERVPDADVFVSTDDKLTCGKTVADTYKEITNKRFFEIFKNSMAGTGAIVESTGTTHNRTRRFMTIKLPADCVKIGHREFLQRINILDSINGTVALHAINSSICVVCANTFNATLRDFEGEFQFKIKHTKSLLEKVVNMEEAIENLCGVNAQFTAAMEAANEFPIKADEISPLVTGILGGNEPLTTRTRNMADEISTLAIKGAGNRGETLLDVFSGFTDYYTHASAGGESRQKQMVSSEFGSGNTRKNQVFSQLFEMHEGKFVQVANARINDMVSTGRKALTEYALAN